MEHSPENILDKSLFTINPEELEERTRKRRAVTPLFESSTKFYPPSKPTRESEASTHTGTKPKAKPTKYKTLPSKSRRSSTMDYSRLDDKLKKKQFLDRLMGNDHDLSIYSPPEPKAKPTKYETLPSTSRGSSTMDSSRLDDKLKMKQLLNFFSGTDPSIYGTSISKIYLFNMGIIEKSTKDRIKNVLDNLDKDKVIKAFVVAKFLPKPDIEGHPVDCLDWLREIYDIIENYNQIVEERQEEIDNLRECTEATSKINKDIDIELPQREVDQCLLSEEVVLPEIVQEEEEEKLPELTDEHISMISMARGGDPNEVLASKFNLRITRRDLMSVAGLNCLNDEVINFYMNLIMERGENSKWPKSYAFNTFFYLKLLKDGAQSLKRWTRRVDLFSYDLICVPVHLGIHWCLAIIDFRHKSIKYYDSLGIPNSRCLEALRHYLEAEHLDKKGSEYSTGDWKLENLADIPQQMNDSDCGMFACTFAEFISRDSEITFNQEHMPYLRNKMVVEIMTGQLFIQ